MIPQSTTAAIGASVATRDWRRQLAHVIRDPRHLLERLALADDPARLEAAERAARLFPLRVPEHYAARMRRGDPDDPLLRQVLPLDAEFETAAGFVSDPVGDGEARMDTGVLQKYAGRALVVATGACAVHCRYCFRREYPYAEEQPAAGNWASVRRTLLDGDIDELILSGGDPLTLTNERLGALIDAAAEAAGLKRIRIHTRLPVVLPDRVDRGLESILRRVPQQVVVVIHANHGNEIDADVGDACRRLAAAGAHRLNQAVLLRGVNDSTEAQVDLAEKVFEAGVMPYYLHLLDRVRGTQHFEVAEPEARAIVEGARARLPGYLVPRLVREIAGEPSKTPIL